jgi:hypothetical protein
MIFSISNEIEMIELFFCQDLALLTMLNLDS